MHSNIMHKGFIDGRIGILYLAGINENILLILINYNLSLLGKTDSGMPKQRKFKQLCNKIFLYPSRLLFQFFSVFLRH